LDLNKKKLYIYILYFFNFLFEFKKKLKWIIYLSHKSQTNMTTLTKYCEACEGECQADVMEYCECCGVGKRNGCDLNPSDESIFDGMCDECREKEDEEEDHDICGQTGGECRGFKGCGKKVLCEDTNMFGNTSFCIPCYEKYEEEFKKLE
jgi:hypothetical protein